MKLYEINTKIAELLNMLDIDEETGEVGANVEDPKLNEEIFRQLGELNLAREEILEYLAKVVLNTRSEADAIKAEEKRLKARRDALARKEDAIMKVLDLQCDGKKTDLGVATVSYRKTSSVSVNYYNIAFDWLMKNDHKECIRFILPEINKTEAKKLINSGVDIPGLEIVEGVSCSLR